MGKLTGNLCARERAAAAGPEAAAAARQERDERHRRQAAEYAREAGIPERHVLKALQVAGVQRGPRSWSGVENILGMARMRAQRGRTERQRIIKDGLDVLEATIDSSPVLSADDQRALLYVAKCHPDEQARLSAREAIAVSNARYFLGQTASRFWATEANLRHENIATGNGVNRMEIFNAAYAGAPTKGGVAPEDRPSPDDTPEEAQAKRQRRAAQSGIMHAIDKYDLDRPEKFLTFAQHWASQAMQREVEQYGTANVGATVLPTAVNQLDTHVHHALRDFAADPRNHGEASLEDVWARVAARRSKAGSDAPVPEMKPHERENLQASLLRVRTRAKHASMNERIRSDDGAGEERGALLRDGGPSVEQIMSATFVQETNDRIKDSLAREGQVFLDAYRMLTGEASDDGRPMKDAAIGRAIVEKAGKDPAYSDEPLTQKYVEGVCKEAREFARQQMLAAGLGSAHA